MEIGKKVIERVKHCKVKNEDFKVMIELRNKEELTISEQLTKNDAIELYDKVMKQIKDKGDEFIEFKTYHYCFDVVSVRKDSIDRVYVEEM